MTWNKIPESEFTPQPLQQGGVYPHEIELPQFTIALTKGDIIGRFAKSNMKDGFYIQSDGTQHPMIEERVTLKDIITTK